MSRLVTLALALTPPAMWAATASAQGGDAVPPGPPPNGADAGAPTNAAPPAEGDKKADAPKKEPAWYDRFELSAFVDTYASINYKARPITGGNRFRGFDTNNGFSLAWAGLDVAMAPDPIGFNLGVRLGPSVPNLALNDAIVPGGIANVQNAYLSWKPAGKDDKLTLIAGKFDALIGHEVALSHQNINYTRGAVYNLGQPFFHTGLRADYQATELLNFKIYAVNGWNNTVDNNTGKSFGAQVALTPSDKFLATVTYLGGPEQAEISSLTCAAGTTFDPNTGLCNPTPNGPGGTFNTRTTGANSRWRHAADVVVDGKPFDALRLVANGTYVTEALPGPTGDTSTHWFGVELLARYQLTPVFAAAVRGEYFTDDDGFISGVGKKLDLITGTLTLEATPSKYFVIKLDNRIDSANDAYFTESLYGTTKSQITTTLGLVAKTN